MCAYRRCAGGAGGSDFFNYMLHVLRVERGGGGQTKFYLLFFYFSEGLRPAASNSEMEHKPLSIKSVFQLNFHKLGNLELR